MPKRLMMNQLNQLELGGFVQKILTTKGGMKPVRVVSLFLPDYYADQQDSHVGKRLAILKEGAE
jgi:hypothetical protein